MGTAALRLPHPRVLGSVEEDCRFAAPAAQVFRSQGHGHGRPVLEIEDELLPVHSARREFWAHEGFRTCARSEDLVEVPRAFIERLADALCYAA